jgi:hypothetical protein
MHIIYNNLKYFIVHNLSHINRITVGKIILQVVFKFRKIIYCLNPDNYKIYNTIENVNSLSKDARFKVEWKKKGERWEKIVGDSPIHMGRGAKKEEIREKCRCGTWTDLWCSFGGQICNFCPEDKFIVYVFFKFIKI